jgi:nucleotide-binding universal stress UspA family protein
MSVYKGILVAADGSAPSKRAVERAARLAAHEETPLYILNVIRDMQFPESLKRMAEVERLVGSRSDLLRYVADKILGDARKDARKQGAKTIEVRTAEGDPATRIVEQADVDKADLIVIGTRGLGGVAGALLGSVSRKVSNLADQDVLIVR